MTAGESEENITFTFGKRKKKRKGKRSPFREEGRDELKKTFQKGLDKVKKK